MTETPPPRRALATFLRRTPARENGTADAARPDGADPAVPAGAAPADATPGTEGAPTTAAQASAMHADADADADTDAVAPALPQAPGAAELRDDLATVGEAVEPHRASESLPAADAAAWQAARLPVSAAPIAAPTFARPRTRAPAPRTPAWQWLALLVLALLLILQILLADRARLAADAQWRPLLSGLCGALRCELPTWHEPSAFTMQDRDVRPVTDGSGALRIQASFRNDARWSQAWPWLQLSLSDADGRVIGSRVFAPAEYLGHPPGAQELLAPGQSARVDFRVREPAAGTAAFTFDFH